MGEGLKRAFAAARATQRPEITAAQMRVLLHLSEYGERGDVIGDARQVRSRLVAKGLIEESGQRIVGYKAYRLTVAGRAAVR